MDLEDIAMKRVLGKIDELDDLLEQTLPKTDKIHRDEIFDILSLVGHRTQTYVNEYGVNDDLCINNDGC